MEEENFSLYKNIKKLCRGIYQSIKNNNSEQINSYIDTFGQLNSELQNRINLKNIQGGYGGFTEIEQLKNSIIHKINYMKQMRGGVELSQQSIDARNALIERIKNIGIKDIQGELKDIEKALYKIQEYLSRYNILKRELYAKTKIWDDKFKDNKGELEALQKLIGTIKPTELNILQEQLKNFSDNLKEIVNGPPTGPDDIKKSLDTSCKAYKSCPSEQQTTVVQKINTPTTESNA